MNYSIEGKNIIVSGATEEQLREFCDQFEFRISIVNSGENLCLFKLNKREQSVVVSALKTIDREPVKTESNGGSKRYIELASVAHAKGLRHGAAWTASGHQVDAQSLPPHFEGEQVCYVYE